MISRTPHTITGLTRQQYELVRDRIIILLQHLLAGEGFAHVRHHWRPDVGWECLCGRPVYWTGTRYRARP